jgi:hypothetical protein
MNLARAGIALKCLCGADMACDMVDVLFDDKGRVKISGKPIRCPVCGAIHRHGERLRYRLVQAETKP